MNWDSFEMAFVPVTEGVQVIAHTTGQEVFSCVLKDSLLTVAIRYDFRPETPLRLTTRCAVGSEVCLRVMPWRIELYTDGALQDEEWPCGGHFLEQAEIRNADCSLSLREYSPEKAQEPAVLGSFENAGGWKPEKNVFVGDCMPFCHEGVYHVLYLKDRRRHHSKWGLGAHQWNHISSSDLRHWQIHPTAVEIDDPAEGSICTGSWIFDGVGHYLFYTVRSCDGSPARICRSLSRDGYHFEKDRCFSFTLSEKYTAPSARDPKVIKGADGRYHMFLTTTLKEEGLGCLAHLVSDDLCIWHELETPLYVAAKDMWEPECPDYFYKDGWYYLVVSLYGKAHYLYSRQPFSGWQQPEDPIIPCERVPKAAVWNDRLIFTGFSSGGEYAGTMTFLEAEVCPDGQLRYKPL